MAVGLGTAIGYLTLDATGFAIGIDSAISDMNRLNSTATGISSSLVSVGSTLTGIGTVLTASVTAPVVAFGAASIKAGADFDSAMASVAAVSNMTSEELQMVRDRAIEMAETTKYTTEEVANAMYYMGEAGWDATQIYEGIPSVLSLAAASGEDLATTSDIVTDALTAFGMTAGDTAEFVNVLAEASRSSNTDVEKMGESFKYVAPVAGAFGYSIQDVAVVLGTFANNGVKASSAGTGLRQALNALINPTDDAKAVMDEYGVTLFNADGSTKSLMTVCEELRGTFGDLAVDIHDANGEVMSGEEILETYGHSLPTTEMEKLTAIVEIFGVRALPGMLSVINASDESWESLKENIYGAQDAYDGLGTAFGMQETMLDNLTGDWYIFTSALGSTKVIISDLIKGSLRELLQNLTELVTTFNNLSEEEQIHILKMIAMAAAVGPTLIIFGKLVKTIGTLMTAFKAISSAATAFSEAFLLAKSGWVAFANETGPLGSVLGQLVGWFQGLSVAGYAMVAVIAIIAAAFVTLLITSEDFRNGIISVFESVRDTFVEAGDRIVQILNDLGFNFEDIFDVISTAWLAICDLLAPPLLAAFEIIGAQVEAFVNIFVGVFEIITGVIKGFKDGDWSLLWQGIYDVVAAFVTQFLTVFDSIGNAVWDMISVVAGWFGADWNMTWEDAKQAVADWFNSVVEFITSIPEKISNFFSGVADTISSWIDSVCEWFSSVGDTILSAFDAAGQAISSFVDGVVYWFTNLPSTIIGFFTGIVESVQNWVSNMISAAGEVGSGFVDTVINFFTQLPYNIGYAIGYAIGTVTNFVIQLQQAAIDIGTNFILSVITFFSELPTNIMNFLTSAYESVSMWVTNMVTKAIEVGTNFLLNIVTWFTQLPTNIANFLLSAYDSVTTWATDTVNKAVETGSNFLNNIVTWFSQLPGRILTFITEALISLGTWELQVINKAIEAGSGFINNIVTWFTQLPGKVQNFLSNTISNIISFVSDMKSKATEAATGFYNNIVNGISSIPSKAYEIGSNIVSGIWNGISSGWEWLKSSVASLADGLLDGAKAALGISSPSKKAEEEIGEWIPPGISNGFEKAMPAAISSMSNTMDDAFDELSGKEVQVDASLDDFADKYKEVFEGIVLYVESMEDRFAKVVEGMMIYLSQMYDLADSVSVSENGTIATLVNKTKETDTRQKKQKQTDDGSGKDDDNGGDTFIFYNTEPDPYTYAKQMKKAKKDLLYGF